MMKATYYTKKLLALLLLVLAGSLMTACYDSEDAVSPSPSDKSCYLATTDSMTITPWTMAEALSESDYWWVAYRMVPQVKPIVKEGLRLLYINRLLEMNRLFEEEKADCPCEKDTPWQVESYVYRYLSRSARGEEIILSGRVSFPRLACNRQPHTVESLSIHHHHVAPADFSAPSHSLTPMMMRTFFNSAVIEPDYEGFGASAGRTHCGASFDVLARQTMDGVMAALEVMRQHGVTLADEGYSTAWGISLGAPPLLAFAKYYDQQATAQQRQAIRLRSCYAAGGPFLIHRMTEYTDEHLDYMPRLVQQMLMFLNALPASEMGGYAHYQFCPEWMMTTMVEYEGLEYTAYQFLQYVGNEMLLYDDPTATPFNSLSGIFASDMCTPDGHLDRSNPKVQVVMRLFEQLSNWDNWTAKTPIYMAHAVEDDQMPYCQALELYNRLAARSSEVHFHSDKVAGLLQQIGLSHLYYSIEKMLQMSTTLLPEEMYDEE